MKITEVAKTMRERVDECCMVSVTVAFDNFGKGYPEEGSREWEAEYRVWDGEMEQSFIRKSLTEAFQAWEEARAEWVANRISQPLLNAETAVTEFIKEITG